MEYFYGGGGRSNPDFCYRFTLKEVNTEMWKWCEDYPLNGPFERWHVIRNYGQPTDQDRKEVPLIQFESRQAAYWFRIAFSEYIIKDMTYNFVKDEKWN